MEVKRKPFQGVFNIIRFNWHFYFIAGLLFISSIVFIQSLPEPFQSLAFWISFLATTSMSVSLIISFYIYDCSDLYQLNWLSKNYTKSVLNINAGFDETSELIKCKYPQCKLTICDFYNPQTHTEISIKRARKSYPPLENTFQVSTEKLPFLDNSFDCSIAFLSAHEIRNEHERIHFFREMNRVTKPSGKIIVIEHLRDIKNFIAYTIGFFHFYSKSTWLQTFEHANLIVNQEIKSTPFITIFILEKNAFTL